MDVRRLAGRNMGNVGPKLDPAKPQVLIYEPTGDTLRLVAAEWFMPADLADEPGRRVLADESGAEVSDDRVFVRRIGTEDGPPAQVTRVTAYPWNRASLRWPILLPY